MASRGATSCWICVRSRSSLLCRLDGGGSIVDICAFRFVRYLEELVGLLSLLSLKTKFGQELAKNGSRDAENFSGEKRQNLHLECQVIKPCGELSAYPAIPSFVSWRVKKEVSFYQMRRW